MGYLFGAETGNNAAFAASIAGAVFGAYYSISGQIGTVNVTTQQIVIATGTALSIASASAAYTGNNGWATALGYASLGVALGASITEGFVLGWKHSHTYGRVKATISLFGLGIECDPPRHELLTTARARELWRPRVLQRSVPRLHRVWSRAWYHEPEAEQRRLLDAAASLKI